MDSGRQGEELVDQMERMMWLRKRTKVGERAPPTLPLSSEHFSTETAPRPVEPCWGLRTWFPLTMAITNSPSEADRTELEA